jgi:tRNA U34 5-carboxymethylaminomethyl modifying GTPase MnmE/TrmE
LSGEQVVVTDTAGLRETRDPVERQGIARSLAAARSAHLVLLVLDASSGDLPDLAHPGALQAELASLWHLALQPDSG